jgi:hypothetical protein
VRIGGLLRHAAFGLGVVALTAAGIVAHRWQEDALSDRGARLADLAAFEARSAELAAQAARLRGEGTLDGVWRAEREGEALALVQAAVSETARRLDVQLRALTPIPAPDLPLVDAIGLRIEGDMPLDRLVDLLVALETREEALVVRGASLRRVPRPDGAQPVLSVQLDLTAPVVVGDEET